MSLGIAAIQPLSLVSISFAGTGVNANVESLLIRSDLLFSFSELGQLEPEAGLLMASASAPVKKLPLKTLTPMIAKYLLSPSFG